MNILSATQVRRVDQATIQRQGITSWQLMERAANACAGWIASHYDATHPMLVLCGRGGNGGDGLAVARMLLCEGYAVKVLVPDSDQPWSADAGKNLHILMEGWPGVAEAANPALSLAGLPPACVIVDALWGAGCRPLNEAQGRMAAHISALPNPVIAIDLPSGCPADAPPAAGRCIQATHTLVLGTYKQSLLHLEGGRYAGQVHLLDIGLDEEALTAEGTGLHTIDAPLLKRLYRARKAFSHKGSLGTAMVVGGSYGMMGAVVLAARAAGRAGAGKVRALIPESGYNILQTAVPEAMCKTSGTNELQEMAKHVEGSNGIAIGPGMVGGNKTAEAFYAFLEKQTSPVVLDAEALNLLGKHPDWLTLLPKKSVLPKGSILTPHPKEFERMFGETADSLQRLALAREKAAALGIYLIMKDRHTAVVTPEGDCYYNLRGNAGMATGGSGDVLAGILAGLLAQDYKPFAAAVLGVHLHAVAGDLAAEARSQEGMIAGDLTEYIGKAWLTLRRETGADA